MINGRLVVETRPDTIFPHIRKTETLWERTRGLLGCKDLPEGHGLLICPCNSIHTFFMKISLDVVFLNRENIITGLRQNMKPQRFSISPAAASVLELRVGQIDVAGLQNGEQLLWEGLP